MKRTHKNVLTVLLVGMLCMMRMPLFAAGDISVVVNGKKIPFSKQQPKMISGVTYVPLRGVFEEIGYQVLWDDSSKAVLNFK